MLTSEFQHAWREKQPLAPQITTRSVGNYEVFLNFARVQYMIQTYTAPKTNDVFCGKRAHIVANEQIETLSLAHSDWLVLVNANPIDEFHSLLVASDHREQRVTRFIVEDFCTASELHPDISIGFNSWSAGASQNHLHAHVVFSPLPISKGGGFESFKNVYQRFTSPSECFDELSWLELEGMAFNLLVHQGVMYLVPRKHEFDGKQVKRGFDSAFGRLPMTDQIEYDTIDSKGVDSILATILYDNS